MHWDCTQWGKKYLKECGGWFILFAIVCLFFVVIVQFLCIAWGFVASWVCAAAVGIFGSKHIDLQSTIYFYEKTVFQRASTFVHEARHISGKAHRGDFPPGSDYGSGSGADESWDWNGAWRWQAVWLAWYWAAATNSTEALRARARAEANVIMMGAFEESPGFVF